MKGHSMTLRRKALLIISATLLGLIVLLYAALSAIMINGFSQVEQRDAEKNVKRVTEALSDELSAMNGYAGDFAAWDESYEFVENPDYSYIDRNLPDESVFNMGLNLFIITNSSNGVLFAGGYDLQNRTRAPVSESLKKHLLAGSPLLQHRDKDSSLTGIILLPEGPMLVISRPILDNERKKPVNGAMIWGRYLNDARIERLEAKTHLSITVHRFDDSQLLADFRAARDSISEEAPILVRSLGEQSIAGYTILYDIYGKPAILLRVDMPRAIYNQGMVGVRYLFISLIVIGLIFGIISMWILEKLVLSRLTRLNADVSSIGTSGRLSERVAIEGRDELSGLAGAINRMLESQERAQAESKRAEEVRRENERLMYASKTKAEFLANMSHELRTPLNSVIGFSELLKQKGPNELNEKLKLYAENVNTSGKHLLGLINSILELSNVEAGKMELQIEKMSVPKVLDEMLDLIKEKAAHSHIIIKKELDPSVDFIRADPQRFKQIMFNLLSNAVKFSKPEGGTVTVTVKKEGDMALFSVSDTGTGIKEGDMDKLFKEFEHLDSGITGSYRGTGLGLAISKKLVELHGGSIKVESRYCEGTTFTFSMPIWAKNQEEI